MYNTIYTIIKLLLIHWKAKLALYFQIRTFGFYNIFYQSKCYYGGFNYQINVLYSYKMMLFAQFCNLPFNKILLVIQVQ